MILLFAMFTRRNFYKLRLLADRLGHAVADQRYGILMTRHSILALVFFAANIWALHLPSYFYASSIFNFFPTLRTLLFLLLFIGYLALIWYFSYEAHRAIYNTSISRGSYIYSHFAFSVPILIPWTLLFSISDLLHLLPYEAPGRLLDTPSGQITYFLIFLLCSSIFSPLLVRRFWGCRPLEVGPQRRRIEEMCRRAGVRFAEIVYWPIFGGRMITAGVMGLVGRFRYLLVTDALLSILEPDEIDQVIAHEIGHVKRKHLLLYLLFLCGFLLVSYTILPISYYVVYFINPVLQSILKFNFNPSKTVEYLNGLLLILGVIIYFRFVFGFFIRNFERQADLFVFRLFPDVSPLIATFRKIVSTSGQSAEKPCWHHFSIRQRVDYLLRCQSRPEWIAKHDRKVRNSLSLFIILVAISAYSAYHFNSFVFEKSLRTIDVADLENYLSQKKEKTLEDALRYFSIGNIYFSQERMGKALAAYEQAATIDPENPDILNNLAWLLSFQSTAQFFDPQRALLLAEKAVKLKPAAHIFDTYAQTLFVNGRLVEAVEIQEQALRSADDEDRRIYEERLQHFTDALASDKNSNDRK